MHRYACESKVLADVHAKINRLLTVPEASRRVSRLLSQIEGFLRLQGPNTPLAVVLVKLKSHLAAAITGAWACWDRSVTHHFDGLCCVRAKEELVRCKANGRFDVCIPVCRPGKAGCQIEEFFTRHIGSFQKVASAIEKLGQSASVELKTAHDFIRQAEIRPDVLRDSKVCRRIGDILIAIDGDDMGTFIANNDKEWIPLAEALGKALVNPVNETSHDFCAAHCPHSSEPSGEYIATGQASSARAPKLREGEAS